MDSTPELILGPLLLGTTLAAILYGIFVLQSFIYYTHCKNDRWALKLVILALFVADTASVVLSSMASYYYLVQSYNEPQMLIIAHSGIVGYPAVMAFLAYLVRSVYAWRIRVMTGNRLLGGLIWFAAFLVFMVGIGVSVGIKWVGQLSLLYRIKIISVIWALGSLSLDSLIACVMYWCLPRLRTGFPAVDDVITRVVRVSLQAGVLTALSVAATAIAYLANPDSTIYLGLLFFTSRLYGNSLMATFTMRDSWGLNDRTVARYPVPPPVTQGMRPQRVPKDLFPGIDMDMVDDQLPELSMDSLSHTEDASGEHEQEKGIAL